MPEASFLNGNFCNWYIHKIYRSVILKLWPRICSTFVDTSTIKSYNSIFSDGHPSSTSSRNVEDCFFFYISFPQIRFFYKNLTDKYVLFYRTFPRNYSQMLLTRFSLQVILITGLSYRKSTVKCLQKWQINEYAKIRSTQDEINIDIN